MKEKIITIKPKGASPKQYSAFLKEKNMDLILLNDEIYHLVSVTKQMMEGIEIMSKVNCFDLCDILRLHLTTYHEPPFNVHLMKDGTGALIGCICK